MFGSNTAFGSNSGGLFSGSNTFGQNKPVAFSAPFSNTFGANKPATTTGSSTGLFGASNSTSNVFGTNTQGFSGFGSNNAFGAQPTNTGNNLFGQAKTAGFGTSNVFGSGFGAAATSIPNGTTVKFVPVSGTDTMMKNNISSNVVTKHQCITVMKEYEAKSLEELRMDDYLANRKSASTTGTGLFGNQSSNTFGGTGVFGAQASNNQPNPFSFNKPGSLFGGASTATSSGFSFGTSTSKPGSLFGQSNTATNQFSFGNTAPQSSGSLFGSTGFAAATTAQSGGLFGSTTKTTAGGFGGFGSTASSTGGIFGSSGVASSSTAGTLFGAPNTLGGNLFGAPRSSAPSLFGQQQRPTFGASSIAPASSGGLFSSNPSGGIFGQNPGSNSLFGGGALQGAGGGSLFGASQTATGIFGSNPLGGTQIQSLTTDQAAANAQHTMLQQQVNGLIHSPYGDSPLFRDPLLNDSKREDILKPTNPLAQKPFLMQTSQSKIGNEVSPPKNFRSINKSKQTTTGKTALFDGLEEEENSLFHQYFQPKNSVKKLSIKEVTSSPPIDFLRPRYEPSNDTESLTNSERNDVLNDSVQSVTNHGDVPVERPPQTKNKSFEKASEATKKTTPSKSDLNSVQSSSNQSHPAGIILTRPEYYISPSLEELANITSTDGKCHARDVTIGREGYGSVFFPGDTNFTGLNLDEIVHIRRKEVTLYPDDKKKPSLGMELNKKAIITLEKVWPNDKSTHLPVKDPERLKAMGFSDKIERSTLKLGAKFIDYRPDSGSWVFEVPHFSKYGLDDDSDEDPIPVTTTAMKTTPSTRETTSKVVQPSNTITTVSDSFSNVMKQKSYRGLGGEQNIDDMELEELHTIPETDHQALKKVASGSSIRNEGQTIRFSEDFTIPSISTYKTPLSLFESEDLTLPSSRLSEPSFQKTFPSTGGVSPLDPRSMSKLQSDASRSTVASLPDLPTVLPYDFANLVTRTAVPVHTLIPSKHSFLRTLAAVHIDCGLSMGRSFTVRWSPLQLTSPANVLYIPEKDRPINIRNPFTNEKTTIGRPAVNLVRFSLTSHFTDEDKLVLEKCLKAQLENSRKSTDHCPIWCPSQGLDMIHSLESCFNSPSLFHQVISLCVALWGRIPGFGDSELRDGSYLIQLKRKIAFSSWLKTVCASRIDKSLTRRQDYVKNILEYLSCFNIEKASAIALDNGDTRLALLLLQLPMNKEVKTMMSCQIDYWESNAINFISKDRMNIYGLLSGNVCSPSNGPDGFNASKGFDWLRTFALYFWFASDYNASIIDPLTLYQQAFQQDEQYTARPFPAYSQELCSDDTNFSIMYHLICLFVDGTYEVADLISPSSWTSRCFDFHLSWFVCHVLKSLGYRHFPLTLYSQILVGFAAQLEEMGWWHWSVFLHQHLESDLHREESIKGIISRNTSTAEISESEKDEFVVNTLGVPEEWIYEAKSLIAGYKGELDKKAKYLVNAKTWNKAHAFILNDILPDYFINEEFAKLRDLLSKFKPDHINSLVDGWNVGGGLVLDYLEFQQEKLHIINDDGYQTTDWDFLRNQIIDICRRLHRFPTTTCTHRVVQAEMTKQIVSCIQIFISNGMVNDPGAAIAAFTPYLRRLSLPEEYILHTVAQLADLQAFFLTDRLCTSSCDASF